MWQLYRSIGLYLSVCHVVIIWPTSYELFSHLSVLGIDIVHLQGEMYQDAQAGELTFIKYLLCVGTLAKLFATSSHLILARVH